MLILRDCTSDRFFILLFILLFHRSCCGSITPRYLGSAHAGWFIPQELLSSQAICYCFGAGEDILFELALAEQYEANVYCFDPAPWSIAYVEGAIQAVDKTDIFTAYSKDRAVWDRFHFFSFGLWITDTTVSFYEPTFPKHLSHSIVNHQHGSHFFDGEVKKLSTIMRELNHSHIDLLKLDIEGAEYQVVKNLLDEGIYPSILCVQFHRVMGFYKQEVVDLLVKNGYEPWFVHYKRDYTFIRLKADGVF